jgi:glycosyltransferase involved in cell wall biosynthesis
MDDKKKSVCIISFSPIYCDGRVLRQIRYLSVHYYLSVIGYGQPPSDWVNHENVKWYSVELANPADHQTELSNKRRYIGRRLIGKLPHTWIVKLLLPAARKFKLFLSYSLLGLGRFYTRFYEIWYWRTKYRLKALQYAIQSGCHAFHANDWEALPIAAKAARMCHAKLVFDAHEYAPLELENRWYWKLLFQPAITYFIKKYSLQVSASVTVAPLISERYRKEFGFDAKVILNTPETEHLPVRKLNFDHIRLVHHGGAIRDRRLEKLIETLALCDRRFSLHFILLYNDTGYLKELKKLARERTPSRVTFHEPVPPEEIVKKISEYDIGFCLIAPTNYNYLISLPNKFFDYIMAGLAVCVGPSPSMAEIVRQYGLGCVAPSFDPRDVAKALNQLTIDELSKMQLASLEASKKINAQSEMKKLVQLYDGLF